MNIIKRILEHNLRNKNYVKFLRKKGIFVGNNTRISNEQSIIDFQSPFLISIGNNVYITSGCTILTHDYSRMVISRQKGNVLGFGGPVTIKNNVFIGMHTTILPNTIIEDNVIIGANSLVKGRLKSGYVYAGNPAKPICSLDQYEQKREKYQLQEAITIAQKYYRENNKIPGEKIFETLDYQWLWSDITIQDRFNNDFATKSNLAADAFMSKKTRPFNDYQEFLSSIDFK